MIKPDHDNRDDRDHEHANDNGEERENRAIASAPAGGALASLAALGAALNSVDTASVGGRSGLPMLQFKRDSNGTWMYGQRRTIAEDGSRWAVNPMTFKWGYIAFGNDNKVLGERIVSVTQSKPEVMELPDKGTEWQEQWAVNLKCIDGTDAGTEVVYKPTTVGGIQAVAGLIDAVRDRLNGGQHDGKVSPIVHLEKDSYQHATHGRVWTPMLVIVDWMPLSGPVPAPEPASSPPPPPAVQPRRRRVG
jgi:hypothetical protein